MTFRKLKVGKDKILKHFFTNGKSKLFGHAVTCLGILDLRPTCVGVEKGALVLVLHTDSWVLVPLRMGQWGLERWLSV